MYRQEQQQLLQTEEREFTATRVQKDSLNGISLIDSLNLFTFSGFTKWKQMDII